MASVEVTARQRRMIGTFHTAQIVDRPTLRAFLEQDRASTAYALGDLDDAFWPQSVYYGAWNDGVLVAVVLVYRGLDPAVLTGFGQPDGLHAIFEGQALPEEIYYLWLPEAEPVLDAWYERFNGKREYRMVLDWDRFAAPVSDFVVRLGPDDASALDQLFRQAAEPGEEVMAFTPYQISHGVFFGVWQDGELAAAAGTHVWSEAESVAAIGSVFTAPDQRGHGYATHCTAAVTQAALDAGIETVVLNVRHGNLPAIHIYEKLGFRVYRTFLEGPGRLRP